MLLHAYSSYICLSQPGRTSRSHHKTQKSVKKKIKIKQKKVFVPFIKTKQNKNIIDARSYTNIINKNDVNWMEYSFLSACVDVCAGAHVPRRYSPRHTIHSINWMKFVSKHILIRLIYVRQSSLRKLSAAQTDTAPHKTCISDII